MAVKTPVRWTGLASLRPARGDAIPPIPGRRGCLVDYPAPTPGKEAGDDQEHGFPAMSGVRESAVFHDGRRAAGPVRILACPPAISGA